MMAGHALGQDLRNRRTRRIGPRSTPTVYANQFDSIDQSDVTQEFRDEIDVIARRINAAQDRNVYGFECKQS